jgi:hypothetical protein
MLASLILQGDKAMALIVILLLATVQLTCLGLLWVSCFPGALVDVSWILITVPYVLLTQYGVLPILVTLSLLGWAIWARSRQKHQARPKPPGKNQLRSIKKRFFWMTGGMVVCTFILIGLNLPQKIAFSLSRPAFDAFIADSAKVEQVCGRSVKQRFRLYQVEDCDRDVKGGIYFQTGQHGFLFSSAAYGFVYRPNSQGSQRFGKDFYEYHAVVGEWYWFKASNDW